MNKPVDTDVPEAQPYLNRIGPEVAEALGHYVYRLVDPRNNETFYIGKGQGARLLAHTAEAMNTSRRSRKLDRIHAIHSAGLKVGFIIHRHGLSSTGALEVEAALIDLFPEATNEQSGHGSGLHGMISLKELVDEYTATPADLSRIPIVLININKKWRRGLSDDPVALFDAVKQAWDCKPKRHSAAKHAACVARGIIREVYQIQEWTEAGTATPRKNQKGNPAMLWAFSGEVATSHAHLVGQSVPHWKKRGAQNPIRWVNC